jgi:hypothetical protein
MPVYAQSRFGEIEAFRIVSAWIDMMYQFVLIAASVGK